MTNIWENEFLFQHFVSVIFLSKNTSKGLIEIGQYVHLKQDIFYVAS